MRFVLRRNYGGTGYAPLAEHLAGKRNHRWRPIFRSNGGSNTMGGARFVLLNQRVLRHIHDAAS